MSKDYNANLDEIMRFDPGNRGLLGNAPANPVQELTDSIAKATGVFVLTGFPVNMGEGVYTGETDGPLGAANIAYAFEAAGVPVWLFTDLEAYWVLNEALLSRGCTARAVLLPEKETDKFMARQMDALKPSHCLTIERPGKAADGHYHNMRGGIIDEMLVDTSSYIASAKERGITTISIGDGGNEIGMGGLREVIESHVPHGDVICAQECADIILMSGVSNWWGWGISSVLSRIHNKNLMNNDENELKMLHEIVCAGSVDGSTKQAAESIDSLAPEVHLGVMHRVIDIT